MRPATLLIFFVEIFQAGGPSWIVPLGRRDSRTANRDGASNNLASPFEDLNGLKAKFAAFGLDSTDVVALSGKNLHGYFIAPKKHRVQLQFNSKFRLHQWTNNIH